jgi:hypothetical protein
MIIYWAGVDYDPSKDWNMLYKEPENILSSLNKTREKGNDNSFFQCPAVTNHFKNTFIIRNPQHSAYDIRNNEVHPLTRGYVSSSIVHPNNALKDNTLFRYGLSYIFFAEDPGVTMSFTGPYFSQSQHTQYGAVIPGELNVSSWFRNVNFEYNLWEGVNSFEVLEDEPIAYINFNVEEKVILKRFYVTEDLKRITHSTGTSSTWFPNISLEKRYGMFEQSKLKGYILKNIKENLME